MKAAVRCLVALSFVGMINSVAHAQCGANATCVTSWTISPGEITGDTSDFAVGTATATLAQGAHNQWILELQNAATYSVGWRCLGNALYAPANGGGAGFNGGCYVTGTSVTVELFAYNPGPGSSSADLIARAAYNQPYDLGMTAPLQVDGIPDPNEPPPNDPDLPCPDCASAGNPINVTNGNTWITQQDYSLPGLAGGIKLTRTWNSLWAATNPPEEVGIFGDSWRSSFEERIQVLTGNIVKYWKANGSSIFYTYNSLSNSYMLTAPANDQTTLSYNPTTTQWIITEKNGTQRVFNNGGYLISIVDLNGNTTTISIDSSNQNRISSVTSPAGQVLTFNYANSSYPRLCTSISDVVGTFTNYNYDFATGRLTNVTYPDGSQYTFQYNDPNSNSLISLVTDFVGKTIEAHTYDSQRRGLTSQQANDSNGKPVNKVTVTYGYPNPWQNYVCDSTGTNCTYVTVANVAQRHYVVKTTSSGYSCGTCAFQGNASASVARTGYQSSSTDADSHTIQYTYDSQGNMLSKALPTGDFFNGLTGKNTWNYTYNSYGEVLTTTDPLGPAGDPNHTTTYQYDAHGNLKSITTPSPDGGITPGSLTQFSYNSNGTLKTITDPRGNITTINYCPTGLANCPVWMIQSIKDANGKLTTYTYDARGNRLTIQDPVNGSTKLTTFTYDPMNRVQTITYPGATASIQFHYDSRGRRDYIIDQNGKKTSYGYDDADRLITVTDAQSPTAGVTTYGYDTENNITDIWDAKQNHTQVSYIAANIPLTGTFPSGQEQYSFDGNGHLTSETDRNGARRYWYYDYQNRLIRRLYPDLGTNIDYSYDAAGRLFQVIDYRTSPNGTYTFAYDNMSRLTSATTNNTTYGDEVVRYQYDAGSNRTSLIDPQNLVPTAYAYDKLNRLASITLNNHPSPDFTFGYDALSRRTSLTRPNGITTTYGYTPQSWVNSILHKNSGGTVLDGTTYTYDAAGNRKTKVDKRLGTTLTFGYDNIYQLLSAKQGTATKESYSYDIVGNRLSSLGVSPYTYNSSNELMSLPSGSYTYDNNGNTKTKPDGTHYTWDIDNQLTQVVLPGSGGTVNFKYDPFGRRIQKAFTQGSTTTTANYLYDGPNLLEQLDGTGNVTMRYTDGPWTDEALSQLQSGTTTYYEEDGLGSVTSLSNAAGTLANTYTYDSFGKLTASTGTVTNTLQYTGREFDQESGLYFNRARYYDASTGRFVSEDPIGFQGGINFYPYVGSSSPNLRDPSGQNALAATAEGIGTLVCFDAGLCETIIVVGGIAIATAEAGYLINNWYESRSRGHSDPIPYPDKTNPGHCDKEPGQCNPCPPDSPYWDQPGNAHGSTTGVHYHWYHFNQSPYPDCTCHPSRMDGGAPPTGGTPYTGQTWP